MVRGVVERLRDARLDPGRRGAAGLVLVAMVAALVAGVVVLRGRPAEVSAPAVARAGVAVPGATLTGAPAATAPPGRETPPTAAPVGGAAGAGPAAESPVVVAVAGRVRRPGLVRLPAGSRVDDAVRAAGGLVPGADAGLLNLARPLVDGEQVLVGVTPPPGAPVDQAPAAAAPGAAGGAPPGAGGGGPVDLNTADAGQLDALPGIGPVLAERIVSWRQEHGRFASVDQLREVPGIGDAKFEQLRAEVRV